MSRKRHRHKPKQIIAKLRDADVILNTRTNISVVLQSLEICEPTYHRLWNYDGGIKSKELKCLKERKNENMRLKRLSAETVLDKAILKEAPWGYD
jgi:putative transposase